MNMIRTNKGLRPADSRAMLIIEKGKAREAAYPETVKSNFLQSGRQLLAVVGGYFRLSLKIS